MIEITEISFQLHLNRPDIKLAGYCARAENSNLPSERPILSLKLCAVTQETVTVVLCPETPLSEPALEAWSNQMQ